MGDEEQRDRRISLWIMGGVGVASTIALGFGIADAVSDTYNPPAPGAIWALASAGVGGAATYATMLLARSRRRKKAEKAAAESLKAVSPAPASAARVMEIPAEDE